MLNALIASSLRNRFVVLLVTAVVVALGIRAALHLPLDAFPDTTPIQVQINAVAPTLAPEEIERQIAFPIELSLGGSTGSKRSAPHRSSASARSSPSSTTTSTSTSPASRSTSAWRKCRLPAGIDRPAMGPVATGLGEVYHYILTSQTRSLIELRTLQDWVIRPRLRRVPGVAEISAWGGLAQAVRGPHRSRPAGQVQAPSRRRHPP